MEMIRNNRIDVSVKSRLFSSARPHDFDGMLDTELPLSMYTTKTPIDMWHFSVPHLKEFLTFSVEDRQAYYITSRILHI
jgi:hypothetical protein